MNHRCSTFLSAVGAALCAASMMRLSAAEAGATSDTRPFRFGFSTALMPDVKENDIRAALRVWIKAIVGSGWINANPDPVVCPDAVCIRESVRDGLIHGIAMSTLEYAAIRDQVRFNRFVVGRIGGAYTDSYLLLVRRGGGLGGFRDLRGKHLLVQHSARTSLALPWFDSWLMEQGADPAAQWLGRVTSETKLSKAVLPVFFGKADACLVTRVGFRILTELNPQLGRGLVELAVSPEVVPSAFFFSEDFDPEIQDRCIRQVELVHTRPEGHQVLTVFQMDRLVEERATVFDSALQILARHRDLRETWSQKRAAEGGPENSSARAEQP